LRSKLDAFSATQAMVLEQGKVFSNLKAGNPHGALMHMSALDQRYSDVIGAWPWLYQEGGGAGR
jgi:hypothetical protein